MPSLRMRAWSVVRFMARSVAAPLVPAMRHCVCLRARRMCWRSASSRVEIEEVKEAEDGALNQIFEFADVARPRVTCENVHGLGGDVLDLFVEAAAESLHEVADEKRDIFVTLAERGDLNRENVQAVVKIAAEGALGDQF